MEKTPIKEIYLDNGATTKVCDSAVKSCIHAMSCEFGNASSLHKKGYEAEKIITKTRKLIAKTLKCNEGEIYFTSGATESNNMALIGTVNANKRAGKKIIISAVEHSSVQACANFLESNGYTVVRINPDEKGNFSPLDFYNEVDDNTVLVSAMLVNNEVGTILPVVEIGNAIKKKNKSVLFHVDAVQGFMKLPINLKNSPIDLLSGSGHKIYAPKGIGFLYAKKGVKISPIVFGGKQENGMRAGTQAVPLIAGLGSAVEMLSENMSCNMDKYTQLKNHLLEKTKDIEDVTLNSPENSAPYIVNLSVKGIRSEIMLHFLESHGIYVSSGSACSKGAKSHVLSAMGIDDKRMDTALRISFSYETQIQDIDELVEKIILAINTLMKIK